MFSKKYSHKIILVGSVGAGKTTSIRIVSEKTVISTESKVTEENQLPHKKETTTAMDYGQITLNDKTVNLYGAPGQHRFDFMVPILSIGATGVVIMINNTDMPLKELDYHLTTHASFFKKLPAIIVVTHYDESKENTSIGDYQSYLLNRGLSIPVTVADARDKTQVLKVLSQLIHSEETHERLSSTMELAIDY